MHGILHSITVYQCKYKSISRKEKGQRALSPIALLHNLIFIDAGYKCDAGFFEVNLSGGVYEAHGEDYSFKSLCLPVHSAGSVHLHDSDFGSALNHIRSSFMISYALEAYNRKLFQVCFLYASLANPIWKPTSREMRARDYPWKNSSVYTSEASMSSAEKPLSMPAHKQKRPA